MSTWLVPREELTVDQLRAVELDMGEHRLVFGPPGSGKTQVLVHRARYLCDKLGCGPDNFRIFVFNNVLKEYISSGLELLGIPDKCVSTFDRWCLNYHRRRIGGRLPWNAEEKCPDFIAIRKAVLEAVGSRPKGEPMYDFVLVDEAQDLDSDVFRVLTSIAGHVTACMDHKQQIYDHGTDEDRILGALGLKRRNMSLLAAFRCCPYVASVAAELIDDAEDRAAYLKQNRIPQTSGEKPLVYLAKDFDDEMERLIAVLRTRVLMGETVAVVLPHNRQVAGVAKALRTAGIEVEAQTSKNVDFDTDLPKVLTYHGVKGLTFDTVLMPRLVEGSFDEFRKDISQRMVFVGITRATNWVYLSGVAGQEMHALKRICSSEQAGDLVIQRGRDSAQTVPEPPGQEDSGEIDFVDVL
ncbi:MAG: hypothetical protein KatS3mg024_1541 [Armatimonadota bacterium]|nr:MAG: hypothetical protein KatS3mg024_1541 [Armatimonadota bacterium]